MPVMEVRQNADGLSVSHDPYQWIDPFAEAEAWAILWAKAALDRTETQAQESAVLRARLQRIAEIALNPAAP